MGIKCCKGCTERYPACQDTCRRIKKEKDTEMKKKRKLKQDIEATYAVNKSSFNKVFDYGKRNK